MTDLSDDLRVVVFTLLAGVSPTDPVTLAIVALVRATIAALAGQLPAKRASRMDPATVLRAE